MRKRVYCRCPYCPFLSHKYKNVALHVEFKHPDEESIVLERYVDLINENLEPEFTTEA